MPDIIKVEDQIVSDKKTFKWISNWVLGGVHLGLLAVMTNIILLEDHVMTIPTKFGCN